MIKIEFNADSLKFRKLERGREVFDEIRKQWILLTPEEWVRQNFLCYLTQSLNYPASLIAVEKEIAVGELKKRCDIVVYSGSSPWMIIECKEMNIKLGEKALTQALNYHSGLPADYIIITNGSYTYGFEKQKDSFRQINAFPVFRCPS